MKTNPSSTEKSWAYGFAISIVAIAIITVLLVDKNELPLTIIGALLGVAMTVFATYFLFKGQSNQQVALLNRQHTIELEQDKESEIFKERLATYNRFLDALCKYVETKNEATKSILKFRTAALAMHNGNAEMINTNSQVAEIIKMYQNADNNDERLLSALFNISDNFRKNLYPKEVESDSEEYNESIKKLTETFENGTDASDAQEEYNDTLQQEKEIENDSKTAGGWKDYVQSMKGEGWNIETSNDQINLNKKDVAATIRIRKPKKGAFYVVEVLTTDDNSDVTKALKAQYKGARSGGTWWRELTSLPNYGVRSGQLVTALEDNAKARTVVTKWIDRLTNYFSTVETV